VPQGKVTFKTKAAPSIEEETLLWNSVAPSAGGNRSSVFVFGVDEAGRGCLAGPVCAAVVCWKPISLGSVLPVPVRDSKLMQEEERERCYEPVCQKSFAYGIGFSSCGEIDRWNILRANHLAVARALELALSSLVARGEIEKGKLWQSKFFFLSDGNRPLVEKGGEFVRSVEYGSSFPLLQELFQVGFQEKCVVKGDRKVFSIASASILAKVSRDRHMVVLHKAFPAYEFSTHKGYSTPGHVRILREIGPCSEHRRSFAPVSASLELFPQA
jgi:ribonuclease HII